MDRTAARSDAASDVGTAIAGEAPGGKRKDASSASALTSKAGAAASSNRSSSVTLPTGEDLDLHAVPGSGISSEEDDEDVAAAAAAPVEERVVAGGVNAAQRGVGEDKPPSSPSVDSDAEDAGGGKPVVDRKLEEALGGQEPTVRNLILAAIGVMKSRKARPDAKRICNWIHRRYGEAYRAIGDELDRLVAVGELSRVDYKGSVSFRINEEGAAASASAVSAPGSNGFVEGPTGGAASKKKADKSAGKKGGKKKKSGRKKDAKKDPAKLQQPLQPHPQPLNMPAQSGLQHFDEIPSLVVRQLGLGSGLPPPTTTAAPPALLCPPAGGMLPPGVAAVTQQVTLRTLVNDFIGRPDDVIGGSGGGNVWDCAETVTVNCITRAVESSSRNINKQAILDNLQAILQREVTLGNFVKMGPDLYTISPKPPQQQQQQQQQPRIIVHHPPPPPTQVPADFLRGAPQVLAFDKSEEERKNDLINNTISKLKDANGKAGKGGGSPGKATRQSASATSAKEEKPLYVTLREERLETQRRRRRRNGAQPPPASTQDAIMPGVGEEDAERLALEKPLLEAAAAASKGLAGRRAQHHLSSAGDAGKGRKVGRPRLSEGAVAETGGRATGSAKKRKREEWSMKGMDAAAGRAAAGAAATAAPETGRTGSKREKKSRKIFDPADHEPPSRKQQQRKASGGSVSPPPQPPNSNHHPLAPPPPPDGPLPNGAPHHDGGDGGGGPGLQQQNGNVCMFCMSVAAPSANGGRLDMLLTCKDCGTKAHPRCMEYSDELSSKIDASSWQCTNCKTCAVCQRPDPTEDEQMLFCDACDMGYHMPCHRPPVAHKPKGKWVCFKCGPGGGGLANGDSVAYFELEGGDLSRYLPAALSAQSVAPPLPPSLLLPRHHPAGTAPQQHPRSVPNNWEEFPVDPSVPDVSDWTPGKVTAYFAAQGFPKHLADIFQKEEIDGKSLLLLQRQDVTSAMGMKLGPALKVFKCIRRLQTRRNFPPN